MTYIDPNAEYGYVIQWIEESKRALLPRIKQASRNQSAYNHIPSRNTYRDLAQKFDVKQALQRGVSQETIDSIKCAGELIPDGKNDIVFKTVETNVNQLSGGIGQFEMQILDKTQVLDTNLEQMLALADEQIYYMYGLDKLRDTSVRELMLYGATYYYPTFNKETKDIEVELISLSNIILDPIRYRRTSPRYIGFHKMISWQDLEKEVEFKRGFMKTINDAQLQAKNIQDLMNNPNIKSSMFNEQEVRSMNQIINSCYTGEKYTSNAFTPEGKAKQKYQGEDVEISYIWDLTTGDRFTVVNRKFIIDKIEKDLDVATKVETETAYEVIESKLLKRIKSPIIEIPYKIVPNYPYPITPLDMYMDDFDELCSIMSLKKHNESIAGTMTPYGSEYDLALLTTSANISGVGVSGMDGTVGFLNKQYDPSFLDSRIQEREQRIKEAMNAYSQIDMAMMIGDRASAKEVSANQGAVASGHNALIHNLEIGFSEIIRVVNLLLVKYNSDKTIKVQIDGELETVPVEKLALDAILNVRLKSEIEQERQQKALMASQLLNIGVNNQYINQEVFVPKMLSIAFGNLFTRAEIKSMITMPVNQQALDTAQLQAQNHAKELQLEQDVVSQYPNERISNMLNAYMTPEDVAQFQAENQQMAESGQTAPTTEDYLNYLNGDMTQAEAQNNPYDTTGGSAEQQIPEYKQDPATVDNSNETKILKNIGDEAVPNTQGLDPASAGSITNGDMNV